MTLVAYGLNHSQFHQHYFSDAISWYKQNGNLPGKIYSTLNQISCRDYE